MQQNGAQILISALEAQGVDTIFGYPGGAVLEIYDALKKGGVLIIEGIDKEIRVVGKACPLFVPLVEEGLLEDPVTDEIATRYLNELKDLDITVTAVCPGPVDTEFFETAEKNGNTMEIKKLFLVQADRVVSDAIFASQMKWSSSPLPRSPSKTAAPGCRNAP